MSARTEPPVHASARSIAAVSQPPTSSTSVGRGIVAAQLLCHIGGFDGRPVLRPACAVGGYPLRPCVVVGDGSGGEVANRIIGACGLQR